MVLANSKNDDFPSSLSASSCIPITLLLRSLGFNHLFIYVCVGGCWFFFLLLFHFSFCRNGESFNTTFYLTVKSIITCSQHESTCVAFQYVRSSNNALFGKIRNFVAVRRKKIPTDIWTSNIKYIYNKHTPAFFNIRIFIDFVCNIIILELLLNGRNSVIRDKEQIHPQYIVRPSFIPWPRQ